MPKTKPPLMGLVQRHRYELIALLTGASVMILEIVGARLIAPYFGTSTYVWTSMIGVILGSLSLGFWYGGKLADKYDTKQDLGLIIAGAALLVLATSFFQDDVLRLIASRELDLRLSSIIAATILFAPPSVLVGMVSPHLAKLRVTSLQTTGTTIGRLEAAGAIGSISGTFLSGYWLLAYFGAQNVTLWLVVLLVATSFLANPRLLAWPRVAVAGLALLSMAAVATAQPGIVYDGDSAYSRYQVAESLYNGREARLLLTDRLSIQSATYVDSPGEPVFAYAQALSQVLQDIDGPKRILIVGGGAHTLPHIFGQRLPGAHIDVAEIDPALDGISRKYFGYTDLPNVTIHYEDGRTFINRAHERYDLIIMDAFNSLTPPFHLTSQESADRLRELLRDRGVVAINAPTDFYGKFLPSLQKTYRSVFPHVTIHQTSQASLGSRQNFLIAASNSRAAHTAATTGLPKPITPPKQGLLLTDDYAPVERLSY